VQLFPPSLTASGSWQSGVGEPHKDARRGLQLPTAGWTLWLVLSSLRFLWGWKFSPITKLAVTRSRAAVPAAVTRHYYGDMHS
jgi:hypothetical protein